MTGEWLVADGCGGYAMGTVCGLRTRRYHGLLAPAVGGPSTRRLGLVALDPVLMLPSGASVRLGVHEWTGGAVAPAGHTFLKSFDLDDGLPRWRWRVGDVVLERELAMRHGYASLAVVHRLLAGGPVRLALEALVTWRDAHGERYAGEPLPVEHGDGGAVVEGSFRLRGPGWTPAGDWYRGVHARLEAQRGLNADEDVWLAGRFAAGLASAGDTLPVSAWAGDLTGERPPAVDVVAAARERVRSVDRTATQVSCTTSLQWPGWAHAAGPAARLLRRRRADESCSRESAASSCSRRPPPQLVLAQARDVDLVQRRDDEIGVRGRQELLVVGSGQT